MDFEVTTWLEKIDGNNFLVYEVIGTEPFSMGPTAPMGVVDNYRMYCADGTADPAGQNSYSESVNIGAVVCGDLNDIGAGVDITISKSGGSNTKGSKTMYSGSSVCP